MAFNLDPNTAVTPQVVVEVQTENLIVGDVDVPGDAYEMPDMQGEINQVPMITDKVTDPAQVTFENVGTVATAHITADPAPAVQNTRYYCDTAGGAFTLTLPPAADLSNGAIIAVIDATSSFFTNNLTVQADAASTINGSAPGSSQIIATNDAVVIFHYDSADDNWNIEGSIPGIDFNAVIDARIATQKGVPNGIASLNGSGKVPASQLDLGGGSLQGTWDAQANNPTLSNGGATTTPGLGDYHIVNNADPFPHAGNTTLDGINDWADGDWVLFDGSVWTKVGNTPPVTSVAGETGDVVLDATHISTAGGAFNNLLISSGNITQHYATINHDLLLNGSATNDHAAIDSHIADGDKHREINDAGTSAMDLWSANKITNELATKSATTHVHDATDITTGTLDDNRVAASNVTQHEAAIDHDALLNTGTNTHTQIDTHIATANGHFADSTIHFVIDDAAGATVTDRVWSADKLTAEFASVAVGSHTHTASEITDFNTAADARIEAQKPVPLQSIGRKLAVLDATDTFVDPSLINLTTGTFQGTWDATTNTPNLSGAASATAGDYYTVDVAGTFSINAQTPWVPGDQLVSDGANWQKVPFVGGVTSVAGKTGAVTLVATDITGADTFADGLIASSNVTQHQTLLDHTMIQNVGSNTHAQIDTHLATADIHAPLDDTTQTATNLWSANKIATEIAASTGGALPGTVDASQVTGPGVLIDSVVPQSAVVQYENVLRHDQLDGAMGLTHNHTAIDAHIDDASIHKVMNDAGVASDEVWSSDKITTELATKSATGHTHVAADVTDFDGAVQNYIDVNERAMAGGLATLDGAGKVPASQLNITTSVFKGAWDVTNNTPVALASGGAGGVAGDYWTVSVADTRLIDDNSTWNLGDTIIHTGAAWDRIPYTGGVTSVAGKQGAVTLDAVDIATGTFADARVAASNVTQHQAVIDHDALLNAAGLTNDHAAIDAHIGDADKHREIEDTPGLESATTLMSSAEIASRLGALAGAGHTHDTADIVSGTFADARIAGSNVTQHQALVDHDALLNAAGLTNNHAAIDAHIADTGIHAELDDTAGLTDTGKVWSADKIQTELNLLAGAGHTHDAADITSGTFADALVAQSNVTQHEAAIDHDALLNVGTNSHADIDNHIATVDTHLPRDDTAGLGDTDKLWSADKIAMEIASSAPGAHTHAATEITSGVFDDARVQESNITQHESAIDHDALMNVGANDHATIDAHLAAAQLHREINDAGPAHPEELYSSQKIEAELVLKADAVHTHDASDIASGQLADARISETSVTQHATAIDHTLLLNRGTNTHAQIDTHIATTNAHIADGDIHFTLEDGLTNATTTWSSQKIATELATKDATGHTHVAADVTDFNTEVDARIDAQKPVGYETRDIVPLNAAGTAVDPAFINIASSEFQGTWDADTNTPTLSNGGATTTPATGDYYSVSVAGSTSLDGITTWGIGDTVIFDGTVWTRVPSSGGVAAIDGADGSTLTGTVAIEPKHIHGPSVFADALISGSSVGNRSGFVDHALLIGVTGTTNTHADIDNHIANASNNHHLIEDTPGSESATTVMSTLEIKNRLDAKAGGAHTHDATDIVSGDIADARIPTSAVTQHEQSIKHSELDGVLGVSSYNHTQIDAHIDDGAIHHPINDTPTAETTSNLLSAAETQSRLDAKADSAHVHDAADVSTGTFADARVASSNVTQHQGDINHDALMNVGTNTHAQIDTHIADADKHREIDDNAPSLTGLYSSQKITDLLSTVAGGSHTHDASDISSGVLDDARIQLSSVTQHEGSINHGSLLGVAGTVYNHTQIDAHIDDASRHAQLNDVTTTTNSLWSSQKIQDKLDDKANGVHTHVAADITDFQTATDARILSYRGATNGVASLVGGFVPASQLNLTGTTLLGTWDANTNTPTLASGGGPPNVATQGDYYIVAAAGATSLDGVTPWAVGDQVLFNGTVWEKIPGSIAGVTNIGPSAKTGIVNLDAVDIESGTFADARISQASVVQHEAALNHDMLANAVGLVNDHTAIDAHIGVATAHIADADIHAPLGDLDPPSTSKVWSSDKISTDLAGKADTAHTHVAADVTDFLTETNNAINAQKPVGYSANTLAVLDGANMIPAIHLPFSTPTFLGAWDALTNTPTITDGVHGGSSGDYYVVSVAATTPGWGTLNGEDTWAVGDQVIWNGTQWDTVVASTSVTSVAGKQGVVVLDATDIESGTFNNARISLNNVTQHVGGLVHQQLSGAGTNDHAAIDAHIATAENHINNSDHLHRQINDGGTSNTDLLSAQEIDSRIATRAASVHSHVSTDISDFNAAADARITLQKANANGLASLDGSGKVPASQLNISGSQYKGGWDAFTNTPTLVSSTGIQGDFYIVTNAGTTPLDAVTSWSVGDQAMFNGSVWENIPASSGVSQINGTVTKTGSVTLEAGDIMSGQFADARISQSSVLQYEGDLDHNNLMNSGVNSHTDIDNHLADDGKHREIDDTVSNNVSLWSSAKTQFELDNRALLNHTHTAAEVLTGTLSNSNVSESNVTQHEAAINHDALMNVGTNTHAAIDAHIADASRHTRLDDVGPAAADTLWSSWKISAELATVAGAAHTHVAADITDFGTAVDTHVAGGVGGVAVKGVANGLAQLDGAGLVPAGLLPFSTPTFLGSWDAIANIPDLTAPYGGSAGDYYVASTAATGTVHVINGVNSWGVGDTLTWDGANWVTVAAAVGVSSVNGKTGPVLLDASDVTSGQFADDRVSQSSVLQYVMDMDHDNLLNSGTNTHAQIDAHITAANSHMGDANKHRELNDAMTTTTNLWSADKIATELASKVEAAHNHVAADVTDFDAASDARITLQKGVANGIATLGIDGKVPASQLNIAGSQYKGAWDANTNSPTITSSSGVLGDFYIVSTAGSTTVDGISSWAVGDQIIFNGAIWEKVAAAVGGVTDIGPTNKTGSVTLDASDIETGMFADGRVSLSSVQQHLGMLDHDALLNAMGSANTHADIDNHIADTSIHAQIDDMAGLGDTDKLLSADKTTALLNAKSGVFHTHSAAEITSGVFNNDRISISNVTQHAGSIPHQSLSGAGLNDHASIDNHLADADKHRTINDNVTSATSLWSSDKINSMLGTVAGASHTHTASEITDFNTAVDDHVSSLLAVGTAVKGAANGVAPLGAGSTVPNSYLGISGLQYQGTWDSSIAAGGNPTLMDGTGTAGDFYAVSVASTGVNTFDGTNTWVVGDMLIYSGTVWQRIPNDNRVISVAGKVGPVVLDAGDIITGQFANERISGDSVGNRSTWVVHDDLIGVVGTTNSHTDIDNHIAAAQLHMADDDKHRDLDDALTTTTNLWSASKISNELAAVAGAAHTHTASEIIDFDFAADARITLQKANANGLASLDGAGKVPLSQLNIGAATFLGGWDANANVPDLTVAGTTVGDYYLATTAGVATGHVINGINNWSIGDQLIWDGSVWNTITNPTGGITSINGYSTPVVTLAATDITTGQFAPAQISSASVVAHEGDIDHTALMNVGTNTHAQIDTHIADGDKHREINDGSTSATELWSGSYLTTQLAGKSGTAHTHDATQIIFSGGNKFDPDLIPEAGVTQHAGAILHGSLVNSGTNTHAQIDAHIADGSLHFPLSTVGVVANNVAWSGDYIQAQLDTKVDTVHTHTAAQVTDLNAGIDLYVRNGEPGNVLKGDDDGLAPLVAGLVPLQHMPVGGLNYKGCWDAATDTPAVPATPLLAGDYYIVAVAGSTSKNGITDWQVGDWLIANGVPEWEKIDNTQSLPVNAGAGGIGVFDNVNGLNLEFRNLSSTTNRIGVALNGGNKEVEFTLNEANIVATGALDSGSITGNFGNINNSTGNSTVTTHHLLLNDVGTMALPSLYWVGDTNTGLYKVAGDQLRVTVGGQDAIGFQLTAGEGQVLIRDGATAATPGLVFRDDVTTGIFRPSAGILGISTAGVERLRISATAIQSTEPFYGVDGSNAAPGYAFVGDTNTGMFSPANNSVGLTAEGNEALRCVLNGTSSEGQVLLDQGAEDAPALSFLDDTGNNTGIFHAGENILGFSTAAIERFRIEADGTLHVPDGYESKVTDPDDIPNKQYVDDQVSGSAVNGNNVGGGAGIFRDKTTTNLNMRTITSADTLLEAAAVGDNVVLTLRDDLINLNNLTGTLSVANGGTGVATHGNNNFLVGAGTGAVTSTKAVPSGIVVGTTDAQTLTNKTFNADSNTLTNIDDGNVKAGANINAEKIGTGNVDNTEFNLLNGLTGTIATASNAVTFTNKTFDADATGNSLTNVEDANIKANANIDAAKIGTGVVDNTEFNLLNGLTGTIATASNAVTFTNKTFNADGTGNSLTNIDDGNIKAGANINAEKIGTGVITNTEFNYLDGVAAAIVDTVANVGTTTLVSAKVGNTVNMKGLVAGTNITLTPVGNDVQINASGGASFPLLASDGGDNTDPSYSFSGSTDTGMYLAGGILGFSESGVAQFTVQEGQPMKLVGGTRRLELGAAGSAVLPALYITDADSGLYTGAGGGIAISHNSTHIAGFYTTHVEANVVNRNTQAGTAAAPAYSWTGETSSGMYRNGSDVLFSAGNNLHLTLGSDLINSAKPVRTPFGTHAAPNYQFGGAGDGIYRLTGNARIFFKLSGSADPAVAVRANGIEMYDSGGGESVYLRADGTTTTHTLTLPAANASGFLSNNGSGTLSWATPGGGGDVSKSGASTAEKLVRWVDTGNNIETSVVNLTDAGVMTGLTGLDVVGNITVSGTVDGVDVGALSSTVTSHTGDSTIHYTQASITATGALNSGSITSGFGSINNGASGITSTGAISGATVSATSGILAPYGSVGTPGIRFSSNVDTGIFYTALSPERMGVSVDGEEIVGYIHDGTNTQLRISAEGVKGAPGPSRAAFFLKGSGNDTGFYSEGAGKWGFTASGEKMLELHANVSGDPQVRMLDGDVDNPTITFISNTNTGLYYSAFETVLGEGLTQRRMHISSSGTEMMRFSKDGTTATTSERFSSVRITTTGHANGSTVPDDPAKPSLTFAGTGAAGFYPIGSNKLGVTVGDTYVCSFENVGGSAPAVKIAAGSVTEPSLRFDNSNNAGFYSISSNRLGVTVGNTYVCSFENAGGSAPAVKIAAGSVTEPSLRFDNSNDAGFYIISNHTVGYSANDTNTVTFNDNGLGVGGAAADVSYAFKVAGNVDITGNVDVDGTVTDGLSDRRLKKDIEPISDALSVLNKLQFHKFKFDDVQAAKTDSVGKVHYNVIAQEYMKLFPEHVSPSNRTYTDSDGVTHEGIMRVDTKPILIHTAKAVQELDAKCEALKSENDALKAKNDSLEAALSALLARVEALEA